MRYVKWTLITAFWVILLGFLHYTLPQRDIARVVETEVRRVDPGENSIFWASPDVGSAQGTNRDVRFINAVRANGRTMVYRNEDTGWGWPPYFKLDSSNLQTEAADLASNKEAPKWVVITHYGWRNEFLSIFPNAVGVRQVDNPDVRLIPWFNIIVMGLLAVFALWLRMVWVRFRRRRIDPVLEDAGEAIDAVDDRIDAARDRAWWSWHRFRLWLDTWRN